MKTLPRHVEWLAVVLILAGLAAVLLPAVRQAQEANPDPKKIPEDSPDEFRRVYSPAGFSIIQPPNWDFRHGYGVTEGQPEIRLMMRSNSLVRLKTSISVWPIDDFDPSRSQLNRGTFQGEPAYVQPMGIYREDSFDDPAWSVYEATFERNGRWYQVSYGINEERTEVPPVVMKYLESFRIEDYCDDTSP
ncbi:MAG: hypothetical protein KDA52_16170 [Planctomycetaceae bacterium]|nr:hypothetical protein [Planctomycetaceae bacterium]